MKFRGDKVKKSVVLAISVIYVLAIVVVGFIGMKMKAYNPTIYVDSIQCISEGYTEYLDQQNNADGYISTIYSEGLKVLIKCKISPDNATTTKLKYDYDQTSQTFKLQVNDDGTAVVEFLKGGTATITIKSMDSVGKKLVIDIIATDLGDII